MGIRLGCGGSYSQEFLRCTPKVVPLKEFPNVAEYGIYMSQCSPLAFPEKIPNPRGATLGVHA